MSNLRQREKNNGHDMRKGSKTARKRSRELTEPLDRWHALLERTQRLLVGDREIDALFEDEDEDAASSRTVLDNANDQKRVPELLKRILKEMEAQRAKIINLRDRVKEIDKAALRFQRRLIEDHKKTMIGGSPHTEPDQRLHTIVYSNLTLHPVKKVKRRKKNKQRK